MAHGGELSHEGESPLEHLPPGDGVELAGNVHQVVQVDLQLGDSDADGIIGPR
jgi:hypothetical protein